MSHFTVMVKVDAARMAKHNGNIEEAVQEMLAPYQENNMGDCPDEFLEFHDCTDEVEKQAAEVITEDSWYGKEHPESVGKTHLQDANGDMDEVADGCGYKKDEKTGKYGYWENPNRKWDWYQIGGRWTGLLRVKEMAESAKRGAPSLVMMMSGEAPSEDPHSADVALISEIDFEGMDLEVDLKIEAFWNKWQRLQQIQAGVVVKDEKNKDDVWLEYDVNDTLQRLQLATCVKRPEFDENHNRTSDPVWEYKPFTLEDLKRDYRWHWEFGTYAVLDNDGWHEKGEMGWWGMSSATPEDDKDWSKSFVDQYLRHESPDTTLAIVDCHI